MLVHLFHSLFNSTEGPDRGNALCRGGEMLKDISRRSSVRPLNRCPRFDISLAHSCTPEKKRYSQYSCVFRCVKPITYQWPRLNSCFINKAYPTPVIVASLTKTPKNSDRVWRTMSSSILVSTVNAFIKLPIGVLSSHNTGILKTLNVIRLNRF